MKWTYCKRTEKKSCFKQSYDYLDHKTQSWKAQKHSILLMDIFVTVLGLTNNLIEIKERVFG
jgi:hypothetical protein